MNSSRRTVSEGHSMQHRGAWIIVIALVGLVAVPLALSPRAAAPPDDALRLIIITPHSEQIRGEFAAAFDRWHLQRFGHRVSIVWSTPGGTSEIQRMLRAQYTAQLQEGSRREADADNPWVVGGKADLLFGGGSYEHAQLKKAITVTVGGKERRSTISEPVRFDQAWLDSIYGENRIGNDLLYDHEGHWFGTALSGFGIVFNHDVLRRLDMPAPRRWADLGDPRLRGLVALVNPGQSGSITTAFDAILQRRGWEEGWRILRRAAANARYFSASASKAPIDVSRGDAAVGVCIDFYGRSQAQAIREHARGPDGADRVGYVDPAQETAIDADPVSLLRGALEPALARRFIEFTLSEQGQALWQFHADGASSDALGPARHELRRMPIRRDMYALHLDRFIDRVNPFEIAGTPPKADRDIRAFIAPLFGTMAMDHHRELAAAWNAITSHPAYPVAQPGVAAPIVTAADVADPQLQAMLEAFDAMPSALGPDGGELSLATATHLAAIRQGWATRLLWPAQADPREVTEVRFSRFFQERYERVLALAEAQSAHAAGSDTGSTGPAD
jgi:iron(III) transport system substrate-binding protein